MILRRSGESARAGVTVVAALFLTLVGLVSPRPGVVLAHSYIEVTDPADGSSLSHPPERVRVTYTEPVEAGITRLLLLDADGKPVPGTRQEAEGRLVLVLHLPPDLAPGTYTVRSETLGADGHPTVDEIRFNVTGSAANPPGGGPAARDGAATGDGPVGAGPAASGGTGTGGGTAASGGSAPAGAATGAATGSAGTPARQEPQETAETRNQLGTEFLVLAVSLVALGGAVAAIVLGGRRRRAGESAPPSGGARGADGEQGR